MWRFAFAFALLAHASAQTCPPTQLSGSYQPITQCRFGQYDFTPLTRNDLYGSDGYRQFAYRLCGAVQDPLCPARSSACSFSNDPNVCNFAGSTTSIISTDAVHTMGFISDMPTLGVSIQAVSANQCANGVNRTVITHIYCAGANVAERLESVSHIDVGCFCQTTVSIYSALACPAALNFTAKPVVTYPTRAPSCTMGQFGIDLRSQFASDIIYDYPSTGERYVVNLCGEVQDPGCGARSVPYAGPAVSACVYKRCYNSSSTAVMYSYETPTWQYTNNVNNSNGYTMVRYQSEANVFIIRLTCDLNATAAVIDRVNFPASGTREFIMRSSLACVNETSLSLSQTHCSSGCCGMGYDWSNFKNVEVTGYTNGGRGTPQVLTMCGSVRGGNCQGAMACQKADCTNGNAKVLARWRGQETGIYWSWIDGVSFTGGVRMVATAPDNACGGSTRRTVVSFICDPIAFLPRAGKFSEFPACVHLMEVYTNHVCVPPKHLGGAANLGTRNTTATGVIVAPMKPVFGCNFMNYDFSEISTSDFTAAIAPYHFITRICGGQLNPNCQSGDNVLTSVCQVHYQCMDSPLGQWVISSWNPYLAQWGFVDNDWKNGVSMVLRTGDLCGTVPRSIQFVFVCDPNAVIAYQDQGFESPGSWICNYFMRIRTRIVCTPPPNSNITITPVTSSSTAMKWIYPSPNSAVSVYISQSVLITIIMTLFVCLS